MTRQQLKKYASITTASVMTLQLAACGTAPSQTITDEVENDIKSNPSTNVVEENEVSPTTEEIVYEVPDDMTAEEYADEIMESEIVDVEDTEMFGACDQWAEDDDGSFECLDEDSDYYSQHFFNGLMFATAGAMMANAFYKSNNLKNGEKRERIINNAVISPTNTRYSSGKKTYNSNITPGSSNTQTQTNSVSPSNNTQTNSSSPSSSSTKTQPSSSAPSSGSTKTQTNINSSSSNTQTQNNSSGSTSSYKSGSSYSSGKSGFSSGGSSRGGSASS